MTAESRGGARPPLPFPRHRAASLRDQPPPGASSLLVNLLIASLAVLFAAAITAHVVIRLGAPAAPPAGLPAAFWPATALLLGTSVALEIAVRGAAEGARRKVTRAALAATAMAAAFLPLQAWGWSDVLASAAGPGQTRVQAVQLVFLTGLHAAHVFGGLLALVRVSLRAVQGRYGPGRELGPRLAARYWHFLAAVWGVLLAVLASVG